MVKDAEPREGPVRRSHWRHLGTLSLLALAVLVTACTLLYEKTPFAPGTWTDDASGGSVTLSAGGTGTAANLPYVAAEDWAFCPENGAYKSYSGPIEWSWGNDERFIYIDMEIGYSHSGAGAPWRLGDWSKLEYWACGDLDLPGSLVMKRDPQSPFGG